MPVPTTVSIAGTNFSGSTMLALMLANRPDAFGCGEVHAWYRPYRRFHFDVRCTCGQRPCETWLRIQDLPARQFHVGAMRELGADFIVDASKDLPWIADVIRATRRGGGRAVTVAVWKDPIEVAHSFWKRGKLPVWRRQITTYFPWLLQSGIPFVAVPYAELAEEPAATLKAVGEEIGMDVLPGQERFWEGDAHLVFGNLGTRKQAEAGVSRVRRDPFHPDFEKDLPALRAFLDDHPIVARAQQRLEEHAVGSGPVDWDRPLRRVMPLWYYKYRAYKAYRRWRPIE